MQRVLTSKQMREADLYTINKLGIDEKTLIERAGIAVADEIKSRFKGGRVLVCLGKGNNGEDGKIIYKVLSTVHGFMVTQINIFNGIFKLLEQKYDIIVDCIFGIGLNREITGKYKEAIEKINASGAYLVSCDIPSGINADTGEVMGIAVKANLTVAIQEFKLGHFVSEGLDYCGEVVERDIGISIWGEGYYKKINDEDAKKLFSLTKRNVNKGNFGKTLIIGGSEKYCGSALLSLNALAALKMGNGYSYIAVPDCIFNIVAGLNPECIVKKLGSVNGAFKFDSNLLKDFLEFDSIAFGMGCTLTKDNYLIIEYLLKNYTGKLLIDADGINSLSEFGIEILKNKKCDVVLTPHIGEFARLIKSDKNEVLKNSIELAKNFASEYNVVINLKSATSIITDGTEVIINSTGCNGMAKAGSGDVQSGIICGLLAKTNSVLEATMVGAYIFGLAGEYAQNKSNQFCLTASDIIQALPNVINKII